MEKYLKMFTLLSVERIEEIMASHLVSLSLAFSFLLSLYFPPEIDFPENVFLRSLTTLANSSSL